MPYVASIGSQLSCRVEPDTQLPCDTVTQINAERGTHRGVDVAQCQQLFAQPRGEAFKQLIGARIAFVHNNGGPKAVSDVTSRGGVDHGKQ
jgi:hypothetical protein